jgi:hypothetical protein
MEIELVALVLAGGLLEEEEPQAAVTTPTTITAPITISRRAHVILVTGLPFLLQPA